MSSSERADLSRSGPDDPGESVFLETNGVRLHAVRAGEEDAPLVVLLHGFPEFWYAWRDVLRPISSAGFGVLAPDQRGYNLSDAPSAVSAYRLDELAADVVGLADEVGRQRVHVVGHDWGAVVAWWVALHYPDRVESLTAINGPHPTVLYRTLGRSWAQRLRSSHALFFQFPVLSEAVLGAANWRLLVQTMRHTSRPGTFTPADFERYRAAWSQSGTATGMLNWHRAIARERSRPRSEVVDPPTLVVWGARDQFLVRSMARESVQCCRDGRLAPCEDATHWVHHEESVRVADLVVDHARTARGSLPPD